MQVAQQPRALPRQRRGALALLFARKARLQLLPGLAELDRQMRGKAVDPVECVGKAPGQPGADRDQHRGIGRPREEDAIVGDEARYLHHVVRE